MTFEVVIHRLARRDLSESYSYAAARAPQTATRWLERFEQALSALGQNPERCRLAFEKSKTDIELREFLFGRRPNVFRVVFVIDGHKVRILRILRAQRRFLTRRQIRDALDAGDE
ncbi:MAG: type II toxin-antitoxin system RelE/ParE family toxin [Planctomycetes bacterium]|nr:type II toxin-antitoxin system RelE/ParE family toxin [Planctomycetota bacterium]